jgi:hypothetical protein
MASIAIHSSETSVLIRATLGKIQEDGSSTVFYMGIINMTLNQNFSYRLVTKRIMSIVRLLKTRELGWCCHYGEWIRAGQLRAPRSNLSISKNILPSTSSRSVLESI